MPNNRHDQRSQSNQNSKAMDFQSQESLAQVSKGKPPFDKCGKLYLKESNEHQWLLQVWSDEPFLERVSDVKTR